MKSDRVIPAILLFVFILCSAAAMIIYALKILGIEMPFPTAVSLPGIKTILLDVVLLVAVSICGQLVAILISKASKNPIYRFFDSRWLPRKGKAETYTTTYGERLEKVAPMSFWGTVVWDLVTKTLPSVFFTSIIVGGLVFIVAKITKQPALFLSVLAVLLINLIVIPWNYWVKDWKRKHTKFIVFTTKTFYVSVRTQLLSLLFNIGNLTKVSPTPISEINEFKVSADPQDFDPNAKTTWLQDQYISWLSSRKNIRTFRILSRSKDAEDIIPWIENGPGIEKIINQLRMKSDRLTLEKNYIDTETVKLRIGSPDDGNWSRNKTDGVADMFLNRFKEMSAPPQTFDLYRVEDPGIYDNDGNAIRVEKKEAVESTTNVSRFFSSERNSDPDAEKLK